MKLKFECAVIAVGVALALAGCGEDSNGTPTLTGTAAVGAPLAGAVVTLKDAAGKEIVATADDQGEDTFRDVSGIMAPVMFRAVGTAGGTSYTLYSVADKVTTEQGSTDVVNITPVTHALVTQALGAPPETTFVDAAKIKSIDTAKLTDAKQKLVTALADVMTALGQDPAKVDLFRTRFAANSTGLDKLLDLVSFQSIAAADGGQNVRVADKSSGLAVTITPDATPAVLKAPAPDVLALDTTAIKSAFIASFNALTDSADTIRSAAMKELFDPGFLQEGKTRDDLLAGFYTDAGNNSLGMKLQDYVVGACDGVTKVCGGSLTLKRADGLIERLSLPVKLGADNKWRAYGDQSAFQYDLKPVLQASYGVQSGVASLIGNPSYGFNLWIPTGPLTQSAILYTSNDSGASWTSSVKLVTKSACTENFLALDDGVPGNCGNFKSVTDVQATAANDKVDAGTRRFKIEAFPNADYSGTAKTVTGKSVRHLFTAVTANAALVATDLGVTTSELGTGSVGFKGTGITSLGMHVSVPAATATVSNPTNSLYFEEGALKALAGKATVVAANAHCIKNTPADAQRCNVAFNPSTGKIYNLTLNGLDAVGRGLWISYGVN